MACPTKEDYKEALENKNFLVDAIRKENMRKEDLINKLCDSQKILEGYRECLDYNKDIIQRYEIYQELSENYK